MTKTKRPTISQIKLHQQADPTCPCGYHMEHMDEGIGGYRTDFAFFDHYKLNRDEIECQEGKRPCALHCCYALMP